jgi:choline dehydrogenase-like flavoprotein
MQDTAQKHSALNRTSAVLCSTQHRAVHRVGPLDLSITLARTRGVSRVAATTADPGTAEAAGLGQQHVSTVADPKSVIQGTSLKHANLASKYDAIVIGSGIGGLAAAVALTKYAGGCS